MMDSARVSSLGGANSVWMPGRTVRNPNSIFSVRFTGTLVTVSTPKGILTCGPGSVLRTNLPKRWTTATSSGSTW